MHLLKLLIFLLFSLSFSFLSKAEKDIDSLTYLFRQAKTDSARLAINNEIIWKYLFTNKERTQQLIKKSESFVGRKNSEHGYVTLLGIKGIFFDVNGDQDSAKLYFEKALHFSRIYKMPIQEEYALNNLGMYHWNTENNEKALQYFFASLRINDSLKGKKIDRANNYNNIGLIYQDMSLYEQAIKYHNRSLEIRLESRDSARVLSSYVNLGECYKNTGNLARAKRIYHRGKEISELLPGKPEYYKFIDGIAHILMKEGDLEQSLELYLSSLNRPENYPISNNEKRLLYAKITENLVRLNRLEEAQVYGELGIGLNQESAGAELYKWLSIAYIRGDRLAEGYALMDAFFTATTEKYQTSSAAALQELKVKYETEKSQRALAESQVLAEKKQIFLLQVVGISILAVFSLIGIIAWQRRRNRELKELQRLKQLQFEMKNAESLHAQKLKIARDLHDNVGSQLTFIVSSLENLLLQESKGSAVMREKIHSLSMFTRKAIVEMRDMLWGLKNENIQLPELQERLLSFINSLNELNIPITITLDFSEEIEEDLSLDSVKGIHIVRCIQEAINNAGKHSKCDEIRVKITREPSGILFTIIDNGCGFDPETIKRGNGLKSMSSRAEELHAEFNITSSEKGTAVALLIPIHPLSSRNY